MTEKPNSVEEYIESKSDQAQERLRELRGYLNLADPNAEEVLKWGKPAFVNDGILFMYAASKQHISLHPTPSIINNLRDELRDYQISDNTIRFPIDIPIPRDLVKRIANLRVFEKEDKGVGWK